MGRDAMVMVMVKELFEDSSLIVSFIFIVGHIFRNQPFNMEARVQIKIRGGLICGVLGSVLMLFSINITNGVILDMRNIALVLATCLGGWVSLVICDSILAFSRVIFYGVSHASIVATIGQLFHIVPFICILQVKKLSFKMRYFLLNAVSVTIVLFLFYVLLPKEQLLTVCFSYVSITLIVSIYTFYFLTFIQKSNALFRQLSAEAKIDFLTGLNNVRQFDTYFNTKIRELEENKQQLSVLMIDIDDFKKVNDTYGHANGDIVLKEIATILKANTRQIDFIARKGGEEFVVVLSNCSYETAFDIAERIRTTVEKTPFQLSREKEIYITISIGMSTYPDTTNNSKDLLQQADFGLYSAKHQGKNRIGLSHFFIQSV